MDVVLETDSLKIKKFKRSDIMSYLLTSMEEVRKENEKKQRILELKEAIKKAEAEWNTSDVEKLKKELRGLTNESFLTKIFKEKYERIFKNKKLKNPLFLFFEN